VLITIWIPNRYCFYRIVSIVANDAVFVWAPTLSLAMQNDRVAACLNLSPPTFVFLSSEFQFIQFAWHISTLCPSSFYYLYHTNNLYPVSAAVRMAVATLNVKPLLSAASFKMFSNKLPFFTRDLVFIADYTVYVIHGIMRGITLKRLY